MAVTKITADFIDADAVETTQIKNANVTTAKVADNAITLAKMAGGTDGELFTFDNSGNPAYVAVGTAGSVLTSGGVGVAPTMAFTGVVQAVHTANGASASGTTALPSDDTIPQITEGDEYMTVTITPKSTSNRLVIEAVVYGTDNAAGHTIAALFQDSTAGALAAGQTTDGAVASMRVVVIRHEMAAGTTSATTFRLRAGSSSGTFYFNGTATRRFGGVMSSSLRVTEYGA